MIMKYLRNQFVFVFSILMTFSWLSSASCSAGILEENASNLIQNLGDEAIQILKEYEHKKISAQEKTKRLRSMIVKKVDFQRIGLSSLGKYRRQLPKDLIEKFIQAFEKAVTRTYLEKFEEYNDEHFKVSRSSEMDIGRAKGVIVQSALVRKTGPKVSLVWIVRQKKDGLIIADLKVEGASMLQSYRQQHQGIIGRAKNPIEGIKELTDILNSNNAKWEEV